MRKTYLNVTPEERVIKFFGHNKCFLLGYFLEFEEEKLGL